MNINKAEVVTAACLALGFVTALLLTAGEGPLRLEKADSFMVTYNVTGTAPAASLTYTNYQGGTEQTDVPVP